MNHHTHEPSEQDGTRYDSTRQTWENIWDDASVEVELDAIEYARAQETLNLYLSFLDRNRVILEAGCGLGAVLIKLKRMGYRVIGLDYAENALHTARAYDPALDLQAGDVHALPYADNALHAYLSFGVLEHFEHGMGPALAEAYRVLEPGGVLVLTIPYPNVVQRLVAWKRRRQGQNLLTNDDFYESTYTQHDLVRAVEAAGFKVERVRPTSHSFTLWGLGGPFQGAGYYQTTRLAEAMGSVLAKLLPWPFNFMTLIVGRKPGHRST